MELFDSVEEDLIILPKSNIKLVLRVKVFNKEEDESAFVEFTKKNGERSLILNSSDYLIFAYRNVKEKKYDTIAVSYFNMATLKRGFAEARKFIENAFVEDENGVISVDPKMSNGIAITDLIKGKSITFVPLAIMTDGKPEISIQMVLNSPDYSGSLTYDTFMQLVEFIRTFDLYLSGKILLNTMINYCNYGAPNDNPVKKHDPPPMKFIPRRVVEK